MDQDRRVKKEEIIRRVYLEPGNPASFAGLNQVLNEARKHDNTVNIEDVKRTLQGEPTYTLHKPRRISKFPRLKTMPTALNSDWQCDLADFRNLKYKNRGYGWLLVCIDVLSRKIYAEPIKKKELKFVKEGFEKIFKRSGELPTRLTSDRGKEFESSTMKKYFEDLGIAKHAIITPEIHAGVVERANRTIKTRVYKYMTQYKTKNWINVVHQIVEDINNSINRGIGTTPNSVNLENSRDLYNKVFKKDNKISKKPKFQVGDIVRLNRDKRKFSKGYLPNYTEELFRVLEVKHTNPVHYKIETLEGEELLGVYYAEELSKTTIEPNARIAVVIGERTIKKGEQQYRVHWIGEPDTNDEWIPIKSIGSRIEK